MNAPAISNVKLSAKVPLTSLESVSDFCAAQKIRTRRRDKDNFLVIHRKFTHVLFKSSRKPEKRQHCNVTKAKLYEVDEAIEELAFIINRQPSEISFKIDNTTATGNLQKVIDIEDFIDTNEDVSHLIDYNPEIFPGLFFKNENGKGKSILFKSGKCVIVGCSTLLQVNQVFQNLVKRCALI